MECEDFDLDEPPKFALRGRQPEWLAQIHADLKVRSRLLVVAPGGVGKTGVMGALAKDLWPQGIRTLVLENRDRLTEQTAQRIRDETGVDVDVEKGDQRASPHAPIVVGCVQSLSKVNRLTGFSDGHFGMVIPDECHVTAMSPSGQRIINYFHYGASSLVEGWAKPKDGEYRPKCSVVGFTASPNLSGGRSLSEVFQQAAPDRGACVNYSFLDAIEEGWLVGLKEVNVPLKIDTRRFRVKRTSEGAAFNVADQNLAYTPEVIQKLAHHYLEYASNRKGIIFVPSVEIARQMATAIDHLGLRSWFVSGECIDKNEKTDAFSVHGRGSVLVNCALYNYGVDFPDVDCIAPFGAMISKVKYIQSIYRGTRVFPGILHDGMTQEERLAAIAASDKTHTLVLSPHFISDRIDICEPFDLFGDRREVRKKIKGSPDMTKPGEVRDYLAALEKTLNKHGSKQPRTINPVSFALSVGDGALAHYVPETAAEAKPPTSGELDFLLAAGLDSSAIKSSGEAQRQIARLMERDRLGLATPEQLNFLIILGMKKEDAMMMRRGVAGAVIGKMKAERAAKWATA